MRYNRQELIEETGRILALAWPIALTSLNWTLMHLIDVAIVGQAGTPELAALAAARALTFISIVMGLAGLSGVLVYVSRADGAGRLTETGDILRGGVMLGFALGLALLGILVSWPVELLGAIGVAEPLRQPGGEVVQAMALAYPSQLVLAGASYFLEGISRPRRVMAVNLGMLPVNAVLAWAWVGGHLGLPAMGAVGAALATSSVSAMGAVAMLYCCWTLPRAGERGLAELSSPSVRRSIAWVPRLAYFGLVPALAAGLELAGFSWLIALSTQLGMITAAAFQAMFSLHNLVFALAMGFGSAAGVRVGNAVGSGEMEEAWPRAMLSGALAVMMIGGASALFGLFSSFVVAPFSSDAEVVAMAAAMLALIAPFMLFDGLQYVLSYALRSLGQQVWVGINSIIGFFIVTGGLGWLLVRSGWGWQGLVYAAGAGMMLSALLQYARLRLVLRSLRRS